MGRYPSPAKLAVKRGAVGGKGEIRRGNATFTAAVCPHCGGKMWPANQLPAHLERHAATALQWDSYMKPLRRTFKAMRMNHAAGW